MPGGDRRARPRRRARSIAAEVDEGAGVSELARRRPLHVPRLPRVRAGHRGRRRGALRAIRRHGPRHPARAAGDPAHAAGADKRRALARAPHALVLTKANSRATVHRPAYLDYVGVKTLRRPTAQVTGERRFLGLYTTAAYKASPRDIPLLRGKVRDGARPRRVPARQPRRQGADRDPRDPIRATRCSRSTPTSCSRSRSGSSASASASGCGCSCAATRSTGSSPASSAFPRDRFNTENRERVGSDPGRGVRRHSTSTGRCSSPSRCSCACTTSCTAADQPPSEYDVAEIEARLVRATRAWSDDLRDALTEEHGEEHGLELYKRYEPAFPPGYRDDWVARSAVADIAPDRGARSSATSPIMSLYRPLEAAAGLVRCKLFSADERVAVRRAADVRAHGRQGRRRAPVRDHARRRGSGVDLRLRAAVRGRGRRAGPRRASRRRSSASGAASSRTTGSTGSCWAPGSTGREITILRAVAKYLRQAGIAVLGPLHGADAAPPSARSPRCSCGCSTARFDPDRTRLRRRPSSSTAEIERGDRRRREPRRGPDPAQLPRRVMRAMCAPTTSAPTCRASTAGAPRAYLSFKLDPSLVPILPLPRPRFEIFVYSPRVEGVHLRGGKVARGGLRWSDRREDFRTEVLGLMKAQMVKNALIVPVGAKGGFVVKRPPADGGREALQAEGIACYRTFLVRPARPHRQHRRRRGRAARRGSCATTTTTRTWSSRPTRAPRRSRTSPTRSRRDYGFWLGDAFASAARSGYDHKQMGITARGAWESVKRHFRELGIDIQTHRLHRRRHRRHVRRRVRQRDAALAPHQAGGGVQPPARVPRPRPRSRGAASRSASGCSSCRARRGATTTQTLISPGGGVYPAHAPSRSRSRRRSGRRSGSRPRSCPRPS